MILLATLQMCICDLYRSQWGTEVAQREKATSFSWSPFRHPHREDKLWFVIGRQYPPFLHFRVTWPESSEDKSPSKDNFTRNWASKSKCHILKNEQQTTSLIGIARVSLHTSQDFIPPSFPHSFLLSCPAAPTPAIVISCLNWDGHTPSCPYAWLKQLHKSSSSSVELQRFVHEKT